MSAPKNRRLVPRLLIAGTLLLACSAIALFALFIAHQRRFATGDPVLSSKLVGTWVGEHGVILQFRPDGSARSRSNASDQVVTYFEWRAATKELEAFQGPPPHSLRWAVNRYFGKPSSRFEVQEISPDGFQLLDTSSGKLLQFEKTSDPLLEAAP